MPSWEFYKVFKNIYFLEHPLVAFSVFCIFFCSLIKKAFRIDSPVFQKLYLQTHSLYRLVFAITISTLLSKKVKIPSIPSPVWSSLKTLWKIYSLGKQPTYYFQHIAKILRKRLVYQNYSIFFVCDYGFNKWSTVFIVNH